MSSINERGSDGLTSLHRAVSSRELDLCRELLQQGADANVRSGTMVQDGEFQPEWSPGETPLILAARTGDLATVELLLKNGADATLCDCNEWGPLHSAIVGGNLRVLELLIDAGADVNLKSGWRSFDEQLSWFFVGTPLHVAASWNRAPQAEKLLQAGADIAAASFDRRTPLIYAAARGSTAVIEVLCRNGADPNLREHRYEHSAFLDWTPLHYAARQGHRETVAALLRLGAEPRARDSHTGETAEEMARDAD
ncbi:ankyrin repeat domain-containing protein [Gemmatimonas sp.]|uniref:ankyrin repeat domain-containing protein n=1 Tax=Gemmatimonas sp. TaxID=1962908 RepID=UPI00334106C5